MRMLIRLSILGLAGYGGWRLYEEYGGRVKNLRGPAQKFTDRASQATRDAANNVSSAAGLAADAVKDSTQEVAHAAKDAAADATQTLASEPEAQQTPPD